MSRQKQENKLLLQMEARGKGRKFLEKGDHDACLYRTHGDEKRQKGNPELLANGRSSRRGMIHQDKRSNENYTSISVDEKFSPGVKDLNLVDVAGGAAPTLALDERDLGAIKDTSVCHGGTAFDPLISSWEEKGVKNSTSVVIIDSDEEDANNKNVEEGMIHQGGATPILALDGRDLGAIKDTSVCHGGTAFDPLISSWEEKGVKNSTSVVIIDSDEDVNNKNVEESFRAWLRNNIKDGINRARASHFFKQKILDPVIEPAKQLPDVQMEVPDHNLHKEGSMTCESQLAEAPTEEEYVYTKHEKQTADAPDTQIVKENQCQFRGNGKVAEDAIGEPTVKSVLEPGGNAMPESPPRKDYNSSSRMLIFQADGEESSIMENEMELGGNAMPESSLRKDNSSSNMLTLQAEGKDSSTSSGLEELWKDMYLATEFAKLTDASDESDVMQQYDKCNHSYFLQDDFGFVCQICGIIGKSIDTIFDYQWTKGIHSIRTYANTSGSYAESSDKIHFSRTKISQEELNEAEIVIHPRHMKQMKPHQLEGFNFLVKKLIAVAPRGCILAHAPGSGKTFMLITFIQSFLARYPSKKPLVVLPKGILPIWKKELQRWQVENIPVYDFYSTKAENRIQQLEVLNNWQKQKSILFLGYQQFSTIIFDEEGSSNKAAAACQEILLNVPNLLILDEGHTPRNENTNVLDSLARVQTPCKVVLSGTLFQNNVKEVFTILNLVCPKFLKSEPSRAIVKRILSRIQISGRRVSKSPGENAFYDLVEENLRNTDNFKMKVSVIQDLREMTKDVLHYYKGDFLEELPGLVDFTVLLKLSSKQNSLVQGLGSFDWFKRLSLGSAIYMHPQLYYIATKASSDRLRFCSDQKIDSLIESVDIRDGVKAKFFLNILSLAECVGEKVLVFSQYILPLRFLERLLIKNKGWQLGREIFVITGDSISEHREQSMEQFNNSLDAKVFFGSIKACGEGISLVGASRVIILDVHLNPSVTRQAIGRAFRPGQTKNVYVYRLVAADSQEEEDHKTCSNKELISKMWFEWNGYCNHQDFELDQVDISNSQDVFLESPGLIEDIKALYRRSTVS